MMGLVSKWYWVGFVGGAYLLVGCAAAQIALEHKDLDVQTQASATIFLAPAQPEKKAVWIDIKSTADREVDLSALPGLIASRGYRVVQNPNEASYWLQANVLYVGNASLSAIRDSIYAGWGGAMGGAAVGGLAGTAARSGWGTTIGVLGGGLVGGAAELVAGSLVKKVTWSVITDVQLSERISAGAVPPQPAQPGQTAITTAQPGPPQVVAGAQTTTVTTQPLPPDPPGWKVHRVRIASTATKVNLEYEEAKPAITERLVKSLAGIL